MLGRREHEAERASDRPRLLEMEPRGASLRGMSWSAPLAALAIYSVYVLSQDSRFDPAFRLFGQFSAVFLVPLLVHATQFVANVRFWDLSDRWDELAGWQRAVLGTAVVVLASAVILPFAFFVGLHLAPAQNAISFTDSSLSVLENAEDGCVWKRIDPVIRREETLAAFPHTCHGGAISWSLDGTLASVVFNPRAVHEQSFGMTGLPDAFVKHETAHEGTRPHLYVVDLTSRDQAELPTPPRGELATVGISNENQVVALTHEHEAREKGGQVTILTTVHAFAWRSPNWVLLETRSGDSELAYLRGVAALDVSETISIDTSEILSPHPEGDGVEEKRLLEKLGGFAPDLEEAGFQWLQLKGTNPPVYVWQVNIEYVFATGVVVLSRGGDLVIAPEIGFTAGDVIAPLLRGRFLLVGTAAAGAHPRLFDISSASILYSSDAARAAVFWPTPSSTTGS